MSEYKKADPYNKQLAPGDVIVDAWIAPWPCDPQEVPTRIVRDKDGCFTLEFYLDNEWIGDGDCHQSILQRYAYMNPAGLKESLRIERQRTADLDTGFRHICKLLGIEGWPGCAWQRVWQTLARQVHGLDPDCPIDDIRLAELFKEGAPE